MIGDTPYGPIKLADFPALTAKINADPRVSLVAHLGDIKAGKNSLCSNEYIDMIRGLFDGFTDPFAYTPGDNEWTDCHSSKGNGSYSRPSVSNSCGRSSIRKPVAHWAQIRCG